MALYVAAAAAVSADDRRDFENDLRYRAGIIGPNVEEEIDHEGLARLKGILDARRGVKQGPDQ